MGLIHNIYTAPIVRQVSCGPECLVVIKYNNHTYNGCAITHPDDEEFFSEKIGYGIALSRARIQILKDEKERLRQEYIDKMRLYNDVLGYGAKKPEEIDPTGAFRKNIDKTLAGVYLSNYPKENIEIFQAEGTHPTVQRNECIKQSLGDIVYFIDNDSIVNADNMKEANIIFENDEKVAIVGGPAVHKVSSLIEMYIDKCMRSYYAVGPIANRYRVNDTDIKEGTDRDVILCNLFIRRDVLFEAGLFDESLYPNEENALIDKILSLGYKLIYNPKIIVERPPRANLKLYIKMLINYCR